MTLVNRLSLCVWLSLLLGLGTFTTPEAVSQTAGRRVGPSTPGGYYVRVAPRTMTLAHTQHGQLTVTVESRDGTPVDNVPVSFLPSEGSVTTGLGRTRGGTVTGTFMVATGSDNPRQAFVAVTVEDIDITVFIDIVPAVFGR